MPLQSYLDYGGEICTWAAYHCDPQNSSLSCLPSHIFYLMKMNMTNFSTEVNKYSKFILTENEDVFFLPDTQEMTSQQVPVGLKSSTTAVIAKKTDTLSVV